MVFVNGEAFFPIGFWDVRRAEHLENAGTNLNFWADLDLLREVLRDLLFGSRRGNAER